MTIRRWMVGAAAVLFVGGVASRRVVLGAAVGGPPGARGEGVREHGTSSFAALTKPAEVDRGSSGEARRAEDDPANLKAERVRPTAEEPLAVDRGADGLDQMLRKLGTRASLLMIVAHPDDEDGGMLAYESRGVGARVGMLTLTRGEGGQNVVTGDFDEALGLVRTRELLAADRYMGVDQMFGTEVDFGFSKTKEEAFAQWTHERVLFDAVRAVRLYRPLVITAVFIGAPTDGHGQHQVSGEIAQEVFTAAADPKVFPEMGLPPWAPAKVYARVPFARVSAEGMFDYATGKNVPARFFNYVTKTWSTEEPKPTVTVPEGEPSADLGGKSYVQFARQGLALQRTQIGAGVRLAPAGKFDVGYTRYGDRVVPAKVQESGFFDGVDTSLAGIADLAPSITRDERDALRGALKQIDATVKQATSEFDRKQPGKSAPVLRDGLRMLDGLIERVEAEQSVVERERYDVLHELRIKRVQFNDALVVALGLEMRAGIAAAAGSGREEAGELRLIPGEGFVVKMDLTGAGPDVRVTGCHVEEDAGGVSSKSVAAEAPSTPKVGVGIERTARGDVPADALGVRVPYTRSNAEQAFYTVSDPRLRNAPLPVPALTAWMDVSYDGVDLRIGRVVGEETSGAYQPATVVPAVSVAVSPRAGVVPLTEKSFTVTARVGSAAPNASGTVRLALPKGWKVEPERANWSVAGSDGKGDATIPFRVTPERIGETPYTMTAVAEFRGREFREGYHQVGYPGLVRDNLYAPATYRARGVDIHVPPGLRVAYLPGTGDAVAISLEDIGIRAATVSVADIAGGKLSGYDALVMGVRSYAAQPELPGVTAKLMEFARAGGVVVVQYQSGEYTGADAPFPLSMGGGLAERVVEEDSTVRLLDPSAQVLRWPNQISEKDFGGWVEERGHGFMNDWDPHYKAVTEVHDVGQDPQRGGLLVAPVGKGAYVYCAYALYRQLPEGVPGAFRLMANMVSLGKRPTTEP